MNTEPKVVFNASNWEFKIGHSAQASFSLQNINLTIHEGEKVALIGESGSGKSLLAASFLGFFPENANDKRGEIVLRNRNIKIHNQSELEKIRGKGIALIPQNAMAALNPVLTVGDHLKDILSAHYNLLSSQLDEQILEALRLVGFREPKAIAANYPHQLSGGMAQRVLIAAALLCKPDLLIADEATSSLDALSQWQIIHLLSQFQKDHGFAILLITHDLSLVARWADQIYIIKNGRIVESGATPKILKEAKEEYTRQFVASI